MAEILWVMLGGALGAGARFAMTSRIQFEVASNFPWGTLTENVLGCFAVGLVLEYAARAGGLAPSLRAAVVVGFLGAFTTFSAFSYEALQLADTGATGLALLYALGSTAACLVAVVSGVSLARTLL